MKFSLVLKNIKNSKSDSTINLFNEKEFEFMRKSKKLSLDFMEKWLKINKKFFFILIYISILFY